MAKLVGVPPNKKSPGNVKRHKEKASTLLLSRGLKPLVLLSLLAIMILKQETVMISKYRHVLDMDEDPNSSDNDVFAVATAVAVGNHNSSSQHEQNETLSRGSLGSASVSVSTPFRLPSSKWLEDIDTESVLGCGKWKCAFPSRTTSRGDARSTNSSSSSNDPDRYRYGYLVTTSTKGYPRGKGTFALAQELSETFSVKHTMLAKPLTFGIGKTNKSFVVQPIKLYSKDSLLFKCNREHTNTNPFEWAKTIQFHSALVDPIVFQERLRSDLTKTTKLMTDSKYSECLAHDAQLVIDSITGSIIQIDIDRCYMTLKSETKRREKLERIPACLQELETIIESMIARKKYLYSTIDSAGSNHQNKTVDKRGMDTGVASYNSLKHIEMIDMARNRGYFLSINQYG